MRTAREELHAMIDELPEDAAVELVPDMREIATLDRRDFSVVRPRHVDAFTLLQ